MSSPSIERQDQRLASLSDSDRPEVAAAARLAVGARDAMRVAAARQDEGTLDREDALARAADLTVTASAFRARMRELRALTGEV